MSGIRVLVAMSHAALRRCVQEVLELPGSIEVVGLVGSGVAAIEAVRQLLPDVILIDFRLPDINGLKVTSILVRELPFMQVIVLGDEEDESYREAALSCGAKAYLPKWVVSDKLHCGHPLVEGLLLLLYQLQQFQGACARDDRVVPGRIDRGITA
jgi:DNA-binding NarL/FixJ family response regulator